MTTTIEIENIQSNQNTTATSGAYDAFASIDVSLLSAVAGGSNWLQTLGGKMSSAGEVAAAAGGVGTLIPGLGETLAPEAVAGAGGATWLLGKGLSWVGGLF